MIICKPLHWAPWVLLWNKTGFMLLGSFYNLMEKEDWKSAYIAEQSNVNAPLEV